MSSGGSCGGLCSRLGVRVGSDMLGRGTEAMTGFRAPRRLRGAVVSPKPACVESHCWNRGCFVRSAHRIRIGETDEVFASQVDSVLSS